MAKDTKKPAKKPAAKKPAAKATRKPAARKPAKKPAASTKGRHKATRKKVDERPKTATGKRIFPELSPRAYEHPSDRATLVALRKVPGFDFVLRKVFSVVGERSLRLIHLASAARVGPDQFPQVWDDYLEACEILGVEEPPELYISQTPFVNAGAVGVDRPFIVLNSGMLFTLDRAELQAVMGHELGHCISGHALYKTMLRLLIRLMIVALQLPASGIPLMAIIAALMEWDRKSELSADRAGLLVAQDLDVANRVQMKLAGGGFPEQMNPEAFVKQAEEYESYGNVVDSVVKVLNLLGRTHPFPVLRLTELGRWVQTGEYDKILEGDYERRTEDDQASVYEEIVRSASSYKETAEVSNDPLMVALRKMGDEIGATTRSFMDWVKGEGSAEDGHDGEDEDEG